MSEQTAQKAGSALFWKTAQHAGVKAIFFIRLLVLARLLSPDDFGLLAISLVAIEITTRVTDLGLIPALVQSEKLDDTHYDVAWTLGILRAAVIAGAIILAAPFVAQLFSEPRAIAIIQVVAVRPLLEAFTSIKLAALVRDLRFRSLAFVRLPEAAANTLVAIALASSLGVWALVAGMLAGPVVVLVLSYMLAPYRPHFSLDRQATRSLIQFGRWIFLAGIVAVLGSACVRLVISRQLGTVELGLYTLGASLAFLPYEIASQIMGEVTFPLYARLQANLQKVSRAFQSALTGMFAVAVPASMLLIVLAPALVEHMLGPKWEGTVPIIRVLALVGIVSLMGVMNISILNGIGKPAKVVVVELVQMVVLVTAVWLLTAHLGLVGAAWAWLPAVAVSLAVGGIYIGGFLPAPFAGLTKPLLVITAVSVAGALFASGVYEMIPGPAGCMLAITLALAGAGLALWISDRRLDLGLTQDLARAFPQVAAAVGSVREK